MVESLTGFLLGVLLLQVGWGVLRAHGRLLSDLVERAEFVDAGATVHGLLRRDLRGGLRIRDWGPVAGDSVSLRVFRGTGLPCAPGAGEEGAVVVLRRGTRTPDPKKDSVLVLRRGGGWRAARLLARRPAPGPASDLCGTGSSGTVEVWSLSGGPADPVALRLFERGSYHLTEGALRYRRGEGGRQPLTGEHFDDRISALDPAPPARVRVRLGFRNGFAATTGRGWTATVWAMSSP